MIGLQNEINDNENDDEDLFDLLFMNVSQHSTLNTKLIFSRRSHESHEMDCVERSSRSLPPDLFNDDVNLYNLLFIIYSCLVSQNNRTFVGNVRPIH